jgi:hypothetical protein
VTTSANGSTIAGLLQMKYGPLIVARTADTI